MVHGLEIEYWGDVEFVYLDIDDPANQPFKERFNFRYQPHLFFVDGEGNVVRELVGGQPEQVLRETIEGLMGS